MLPTWSCAMLMTDPICRGRRQPRGPPVGRGCGWNRRAIHGPQGYHYARARPNASTGRAAHLSPEQDMRTVQLAILAAAVAASTSGAAAETKHDTARISPMADNPFAQPSTLAFQLPPFDRIRDADYLPAFEAG